MPRHKKEEKTWADFFFESPGYGPPDGTINSLNNVEHSDHVEMLTEKLMDDDIKKRYKAAEALAHYIADDEYLPEYMEVHPAEVLATAFMKMGIDRQFCISACRSLQIMGVRAAPYASFALTKVLFHPAQDLRYEAIAALRSFGPDAADEAAAPLAKVIIEDEEPRLRREALKTIIGIGPGAASAAGKSMCEATQDEDNDVQVTAIKCMETMGPELNAELAAPYLQRILEHGSQELRRLAMDAIIAIGSPLAKHLQVDVARHLRPIPGSDPKLRLLAVHALVAMGPAVVYEQEIVLARALQDPDFDVKSAAFEALRDAHCVKGMHGSMELEERFFSQEILQRSRPEEYEDDSDSDGSSEELQSLEDSLGSDDEPQSPLSPLSPSGRNM